MRTYVIAEAGSCHDGNYSKAEALTEQAWRAGADCVKFQYWSDPHRLADRRRVPDQYRAIYIRYALPKEWLPLLASRAAHYGIDFICTVYVPEDIEVVAPHVRQFKVASFEAGDANFVHAHAAFNKPIIVSVGMTSAEEAWVIACSLSSRDAVLHCVSAYAAPIEQVNLARLRGWFIEKECGGALMCRIGFSDHTKPAVAWTGGLAVAAGAQVVEAHLCLETTDWLNPDVSHAMMPRQFQEYVRNIRFAETIVGPGHDSDGVQPCEAEMAQYRVTP